ncbi:MAG: hypothetical protein AAB947_00205 [Patescibacteria group bacterium]
MRKQFWNTVLAVNSGLWFISVGFLSYAFGMLIVALDWKLFLLALATFVVVSLVELILTILAT